MSSGTRDRRTPLPPWLRASSYAYALPRELVAQEPAPRREDSRLLHVDRNRAPGDDIQDLAVPDLPSLLHPGDLVVLNDTRVVPARLFGVRRATGGRVEVLLLDHRGRQVRALVKTRGRLRPGEELSLGDGAVVVRVLRREEDATWHLETVASCGELTTVLDRVGRLPLPPYIRRAAPADPRDALDRDRYQTVYARIPGAVAAPTAGLHLTPELLDRLARRGVETATVTLHVGPGSFRPVTTEDVRDHPMHEEAYEVGPEAAEAVARCRARRGRVIPIGTTSVRVLETAGGEGGRLRVGAGRTRLFIHPPWRFRLTDALLTNFHAPRSTLLMLVAALAGPERILRAYRHAVLERYRFLSYGDAMFIT